MLHKNTLLCAGLGAVFLFAQVPLASAAVVTSMKPLGFIAAAIADGVTETQVLLPDGASEHDYSLRPSDVKRLQNADLVVWIGPEMEAFMDKSTQSIAANKKVTIAELDGVKPLLITGADDELMPQSRAKLDSNLQQFETALAATDKQVSNELAPLKGKGYFVFHDAYGYFEKHYGLTSLGHFTVNPEIQPGAQRLHEIRTQLVEQKATCVFAEPQFRPAVIEAVARGTSVRMGTLDPLGTGITLGKTSYPQFLTQLANQYSSCLKGD
ncbi:MAG: zinc ABC transporter substrate-binding protein [Klebsiella pneumoniae]|nr:zinc ABC transporter substrate-binding protein [Klebsiella pneumoniae]